jgi:hypothetical protein
MFNPLTHIVAQRRPNSHLIAESAAIIEMNVEGTTELHELEQAGTANINTTGSASTDIGTGASGEVHIGNTVGGTHITGYLGIDGDCDLNGDFTQTGLFIHDGGDCFINASGDYSTYIGTDSSGYVEIGNTVGGIKMSGALLHVGDMTQVDGDCNINTSGCYDTNIGTTSSGSVTIGNTIGGTTIVGDLLVQGLITTSSGVAGSSYKMPKLPYMPYDEITVKYEPLIDLNDITIIFQTNWLADNWNCSVVHNGVGDYTFRLDASGHGATIFGTVYFTNFQSSGNFVIFAHQNGTWTTHTCQVRVVDVDGNSGEANGFYTFRIARETPG